MAAISTALGILSGLANVGGAIMGAEKNKQAERDLLAQRSDIDRELATSAMDNIATQAYFKQMERNRDRAMAGIDNGIIAGGATAENALAQKQKLNEQVDNAAQNFLMNKENQKRGWLYDRRSLTNAINQGRAQQAQNWVTLAGNIANTAQNLGEAYLEDGGKMLDNAGASMSEEAKDAALDSLKEAGKPDTTVNVEKPNLSPAPLMDKEASIEQHDSAKRAVADAAMADANQRLSKSILGENGSASPSIPAPAKIADADMASLAHETAKRLNPEAAAAASMNSANERMSGAVTAAGLPSAAVNVEAPNLNPAQIPDSSGMSSTQRMANSIQKRLDEIESRRKLMGQNG